MGKRWAWVLLALTLAAGTTACSAGRGNAPAPAASVTPSAAASTEAARTTALSGKPAIPLPDYQPSKVVSKSIGGIQLSSIDSVTKVTRFYMNVLKSRGWRIIYSSKSATNINIVAMRGTTGLGISIGHGNPAGTAIIVTKCDC